jgi:hypothetical protein
MKARSRSRLWTRGDLIIPASMHEADDLVFPIASQRGQPRSINLTMYTTPRDSDCLMCAELYGFRVPSGQAKSLFPNADCLTRSRVLDRSNNAPASPFSEGSAVTSDAPPPTPSIPPEKTDQIKSDSNEEERPTKGSDSERIIEAIAALNRTLAEQSGANRTQERREDTGNKRLQALTLIFVILTTIGIFWQASIFNHQLTEAKKVFGPIQDQAKASQQAADAATKQSQNAEKALIEAQRAWVGPQNASFASEPGVGKPIEITVQYQNTGREPALSFIYFATPFSVTTEDDSNGTLVQTLLNYMNACKAYREWTGGSVVYPSTGFSSYNLNVTTKDDFVDEPATKGDKVIIVQGCFLYRSFDNPRHSYFCYFYKQGQSKIQNLNICPTGHYAD